MNKFTKLILTTAVFATGVMAAEGSINTNISGGTVIDGKGIDITEGHTLTLCKNADLTGDKAKLIVNHGPITGKGTLKGDGEAILCNLYTPKEIEDTDNFIKDEAKKLLGEEQEINDVYAIGERGYVGDDVIKDQTANIRNYSLLSTLNHWKVIENKDIYGQNRLFNLTVPENTEDDYEHAIGIGGTWTGTPAQAFKDAKACIATIKQAGQEAAGIRVESSEFDLNMIRACTGSVFVNTSDSDMELKVDKDCKLPGKFVTSTESTAETKPTITINGNEKTLTFEKEFNASATGINLKDGIFVFENGLTV